MPKSISIPVLTAIVAGFALLAGALVLGATSYFLSMEGLFIVIGGSVANAVLSFPRDDIRKAFAAIAQLLQKPNVMRGSLHEDIMHLITWAYVVKDRDLIGLEKEASTIDHDPMLRYGMDLVVTAYSPDRIREMMHTVADAEFERRCLPVTILRNMAATAPAFGMVGTLIGMMILLKNVGMDISNIGNGLAIAMLSTLYGILAARLICLPAADKLLQKEEYERFRNYMLTEGLAMLAAKENPFYMQDKLNSFLEPTKQFDLNNHRKFAFERRQFAMAA